MSIGSLLEPSYDPQGYFGFFSKIRLQLEEPSIIFGLTGNVLEGHAIAFSLFDFREGISHFAREGEFLRREDQGSVQPRANFDLSDHGGVLLAAEEYR